MLTAGLEKLVEKLAPASVNVLQPTPPNQSHGLNLRVYEQMRRDFMIVGPFVLHGETPGLLAACWSLVRETLICGNADRGEKETVAWAVSISNQCPFCIDTHGAAVHAAGTTNNKLVNWARASAQSGHTLLKNPPITDYRAEFLGTLVAFHYLNRMVSIFMGPKMMPVPDVFDSAAGAMAKLLMGGLIRKVPTLKPGDSVALLPDYDPSLAWTPDWANSSPNVAAALAGWSAIVEGTVRQHYPESFLSSLALDIDGWDGTPVPTGHAFIKRARQTFPAADHAAAELALYTVFAPYRITRGRVEKSIDTTHNRSAILALVAWASQRAARRCAHWSSGYINSAD